MEESKSLERQWDKSAGFVWGSVNGLGVHSTEEGTARMKDIVAA